MKIMNQPHTVHYFLISLMFFFFFGPHSHSFHRKDKSAHLSQYLFLYFTEESPTGLLYTRVRKR